jgi:hypothetical protein
MGLTGRTAAPRRRPALGRTLAACGALLSALAATHCSGGTCAPPESPYPEGYLRHATAPAGYPAVVGWGAALQDREQGGDSAVEVDWMRVHAVVDGQDRVILADEFDRYAHDMAEYGRYSRSPWFGVKYGGAESFSVADGALHLAPSTHPDQVFHWWNLRRVTVPPGASRVWVEVRTRITGHAKVQVGVDYWRSLTVLGSAGGNNVEAGASAWLCDDQGWTTLTFGKP